jgi:hypothetical protein
MKFNFNTVAQLGCKKKLSTLLNSIAIKYVYHFNH